MALKKSVSTAKSTKKNSKTVDPSVTLKDAVVEGMKEMKAKEIVFIDLRSIKNAVADFFVICHADSSTHIDAIARSIEEVVEKQTGDEPLHVEGRSNGEWVLIDYSNVVAHVFRQDKREFYGLERLWADAEIGRIAGNY